MNDGFDFYDSVKALAQDIVYANAHRWVHLDENTTIEDGLYLVVLMDTDDTYSYSVCVMENGELAMLSNNGSLRFVKCADGWTQTEYVEAVEAEDFGNIPAPIFVEYALKIDDIIKEKKLNE